MHIIRTIKKLRSILKAYKQHNQSIGFVPTLGALHEGHGSLLKKARRENDVVVLSIFVNPIQFGPQEDFRRYPRVLRRDKSFAKKEKVDIIFYPSVEEMYPKKILTVIHVHQLTKALCGPFRPGHFIGVTTVVGKLFNIVLPDQVYFGQKDAQQAIVIKQMINDLNFPINMHMCATIREKDGLALSSRNAYLTDEERKNAPHLYQCLQQAEKMIHHGITNPLKIQHFIRKTILDSGFSRIDYISCVQAESLERLKVIKGKVFIAVAAWIGKTRLIDNIVLTAK